MNNETEECIVMEPYVLEESNLSTSQSAISIPQYYGVEANKWIGEAYAAFRDDRINTKRAISASIASNAQIQKQSSNIIEACKRELQREDISDSRRDRILDRMAKAAEISAISNKECCEFQANTLDHSHKLPWRLVGSITVLVIVGFLGVKVLPKISV